MQATSCCISTGRHTSQKSASTPAASTQKSTAQRQRKPASGLVTITLCDTAAVDHHISTSSSFVCTCKRMSGAITAHQHIWGACPHLPA